MSDVDDFDSSKPEEYSNARRRRHLHDYRELVSNTRLQIADNNQLDRDEKRRYLYEVTRTLVMESETTIKADSVELSQNYWDDVELGTITLEPPNDAVDYYTSHLSHMPPGSTPPQTRQCSVIGFDAFIQLRRPITETWTVSMPYKGSVKSKSWTKQMHVPMSVSDAAYRACNRFFSEIGMDVNIGVNDEVEWSYADMFPGREENSNE